jgi:hypothetical protein
MRGLRLWHGPYPETQSMPVPVTLILRCYHILGGERTSAEMPKGYDTSVYT